MKKPFIRILFLLVINGLLGNSWFASKVLAQPIKGITIALTTESIAFPLTRITPVHPGIELGLTVMNKRNFKRIKEFNLVSGFYHHELLENAFYLKAEYLYRPIFGKVTLDLSGSAGYMHTFYPGPMYQISETGEPETVKQFGRPHGLLGLGFGITFIGTERFNPFIRQDFIVKAPFANGIPAIIHSILKVGTTINLNRYEN